MIIYLQKYWEWLTIIILPPIVLIFLYIFVIKQNPNKHNIKLRRHLQINFVKNYIFAAQLCIFLIFLVLYIYALIYGEDFAYHDNDHYTLFSLAGKFFDMPVWPWAGRVFPLGHQEFNIIGALSKSPLAYHLFPVFQLVLLVLIIWLILDKKNRTYKLLTVLFLLTTNTFVISFQGLIFPERNLIFWLAILVLSIQKFEKYNSTVYFCTALTGAQLLIYYKEPGFLLVFGIAISRLLIDLINTKSWNRWWQIVQLMRRRFLETSLIILSSIFLLIYAIKIIPETTSSYAEGFSQLNVLATLESYIRKDLVLVVFLATVFIRSIYLLVARKSPDSLWDSLAIAVVLYFLAYVKLGMYRSYYGAPIDFIAVLYLANLIYTFRLERKKNRIKAFVILILICLLFMQNISLSSYSILARKKIIESRALTAQFILEDVNSNKYGIDQIDLFFPVNSNYTVMQFISYLNYKTNKEYNAIGITNIKPRLSQSRFTMKIYTGNKSDNDLCVSYRRNIKCYHKNTQVDAELVVYIPQDGSLGLFNSDINTTLQKAEAQIHEFIETADKAKTIFKYQPEFRGLEKVLLFFVSKKYIDSDWLNSYVLSN